MKITEPDDPIRTGYTLSGWYQDGALSVAWDFDRIISSGNITLYAKWEAIIYPVTYHLDGGSQNPDNPETYTIEDSITLQIPSKTGGSFTGWFTESELLTEIVEIPAGSTGAVELWAGWINAEYVLTWHLNGGTNSSLNPATYFYDDPPIPLHSATRAAYTFEGWYGNPGFLGDPVASIPHNSTGDRDFYALWEAIVYIITWHPLGGSDPENAVSYTVEDTIPFAPSERAGYAFTGWYNNSSFMGSPDSGIVPGMYGEKNYYARWNVHIWQISYILNGGLNSHHNPASYTIESSSIIFEPPTRRGYTFEGWYVGPDFEGSPVADIPHGSTEDVTLYAKWEVIVYPVEYVLSGGTNSPENVGSYTVEDAVTLYDAERPGYSFSGWFDNAGFIDSPISVILRGSIGTFKFFARWTKGVTFPTGRENRDRYGGDPAIF
jgi:uncharacterized repeat protein (TIGR02543 family)